MNKAKIVELLRDGAYLNIAEGRFYHPSFRKGYRALQVSNISFAAAEKVLGDALKYDSETKVYKIES